jgi:DNA polymerase elongation subunit (family B)
MNLIFESNFIIEDLGIQEVDVYDIEVENNHNFFANNIAVHNSTYFCLTKVLDKYTPKATVPERIKMIEKLAKDKLTPIIAGLTSEIGIKLNVYENTFNMKLEMAASHFLITGKKRYIARVFSSEGVTYNKPKLKIMGMDLVKSSTPKVVQTALRDSIDMILDTDEATIQGYIAGVKEGFMILSPEAIAFPRGVSNIKDYASASTIYTKGTPMHVRASLLYNNLIKKHKLTKTHDSIKDGNKIRFIYLKEPNTLRENIIGWPVDGHLPPEFGLHKYIDYDLQFEKVFLSPIEGMIKPLGWSSEHKQSLDDFF